MRSLTIDMGGPVHVADFGGPGGTFVLVHGLGGSYVDWLGVGPELAERARVIAPDLIGHGKTPLGERSAAIPMQVRLLDRLIDELAGGSATLVGNSMGGLVSILEAADSPHRVAALVLVDPAVPPAPGVPLDPITEQLFAAYDTPGIGESLLAELTRSIGVDAAFEQAIAYICADPARISPDLLDAELAMARQRALDPSADRAFLEAARSMLAILWHDPKVFRTALAKVEAPTLVVQGGKDRLVLPSAIQALGADHPGWEVRFLPEVGHAPMLEDPVGFLDIALPWLDQNGLVERTTERVPGGRDGR